MREMVGLTRDPLHARILAARTQGERHEAYIHATRQPWGPDVPCELIPLAPLCMLVARMLDRNAQDVLVVFALQMLGIAVFLAGWARHVMYGRDIGVLAFQPMSDGAYFDRQVRRIAVRASLVFLAAAVFPWLLTMPLWSGVLLLAWGVVLALATVLYIACPSLRGGGALFALVTATLLPLVLPSLEPFPGYVSPTDVAMFVPTWWPLLLVAPGVSLPKLYCMGAVSLAVAASAPLLYRLARATFEVREIQMSTASDPTPGAAAQSAAFPLPAPPAGATIFEAAALLKERRLRRQEMLEPTVRAAFRETIARRSRGFIERLLDRLYPEDRAARRFLAGGDPNATSGFIRELVTFLALWLAIWCLPREGGQKLALAVIALPLLGLRPLVVIRLRAWRGLGEAPGHGSMPLSAPYPLDVWTASRVFNRTVWLVTLLWVPVCLTHALLCSHLFAAERIPFLLIVTKIVVLQLVVPPVAVPLFMVLRTSWYGSFGSALAVLTVTMVWLIVALAVGIAAFSADGSDAAACLGFLAAITAAVWYVLCKHHERSTDLALPSYHTVG